MSRLSLSPLILHAALSVHLSLFESDMFTFEFLDQAQ